MPEEEPQEPQAGVEQGDEKETGTIEDLPEWARDSLTKANKEAASYRKRVKELEPLASKAQELEDSKKSEIERATEKVTAAETRAQEAELRALRVEVAVEKGLTATLAKRLDGTTREELEVDADALLEQFPAGNQRPKPDPDQGKESSAKKDPDAWLRDAARK